MRFRPAGSGAEEGSGRKGYKAALQGLLIALAALVVVSQLAGCAKEVKKVPPKKPPAVQKVPKPEPPAAVKPPPKKEAIQTNSMPSTQMASTPKRQASVRLVEFGTELMGAGQYNRAANSFRDAVSVDPTNGVAYYWLAAAQGAQGMNQSALGLLDKAQALLGADEEWMTKIDDLRGKLGGETQAPAKGTPISF